MSQSHNCPFCNTELIKGGDEGSFCLQCNATFKTKHKRTFKNYWLPILGILALCAVCAPSFSAPAAVVVLMIAAFYDTMAS